MNIHAHSSSMLGNWNSKVISAVGTTENNVLRRGKAELVWGLRLSIPFDHLPHLFDLACAAGGPAPHSFSH